MIPKEKASELVKSFRNYAHGSMVDEGVLVPDEVQQQASAKECALICVNSLIEEHTWSSPINWNLQRKKYWEQVKSEIEKL